MIPTEPHRKSGSKILRVDSAFECTIVDRPNRFVVRVKEGRKLRKAHINNTGRLHEFLVKGKRGFCTRTGKGGKTDCRLFAVEERGLGALIDTRLQMKSFEESLEKGCIPWLKNCFQLKRNVRIGNSLIDYLLECPGKAAYLEVKSAVLRKGTSAMYPDCPSLRGQRHIKELSEHVQKGGKGIILFIAALPEVKTFQPNRQADPVLFELLKSAQSQGVVLKAIGLYFDPTDSFIYLFNPDLKIFLV